MSPATSLRCSKSVPSLLLLFVTLLHCLPLAYSSVPIYTAGACTEPCQTGAEDCCAFIPAPLYSQTSGNRIAFYSPQTDEYNRMMESNRFLVSEPSSNHLDFSLDGSLLFTSNVNQQAVFIWDAYEGEIMDYSCAYEATDDNWLPTVLRVNKHDGLVYVATLPGSSTPLIIKYDTFCFEYDQSATRGIGAPLWTEVWNNGGGSAGATTTVLDFAFGDETTLFVLALTTSYRVYRVNLTTGTHSSLDLGTAMDQTSIEALPDNRFFVASRFSDSTGLRPSNDLDGWLREFDGKSSLMVYTKTILKPTKPEAIDIFHVRAGPNGLLYLADFSFDLPLVVSPDDGQKLGRLGASFGFLIFALKEAFNPGPFPPNCEVVISSTSLIAGETLTVTVDLFDGANEPFCYNATLTAVVGGVLWVGSEPTSIDNIARYTDFKIVPGLGGACNRRELKLQQPTATLKYTVDDVVYVDARLAAYLEANENNPDFEELESYSFFIEVNVGKVDFGLQLGSHASLFDVRPSEPDASHTTLEISMAKFVSNEKSCVYVLSQDEFGNALVFGGYVDDFTFSVGEDLDEDLSKDNDALGLNKYEVTFEDNEDGSYTVCANVGPAGISFIHIFFQDVEIRSSPLSAVVATNRPTGAFSTADGDGIFSVDEVEGFTNEIKLQSRDARLNFVPVDHIDLDTLVVTVDPTPSTLKAHPDLTIAAEKLARSDGTIAVIYRLSGKNLNSNEPTNVVVNAFWRVPGAGGGGASTKEYIRFESFEGKELKDYPIYQLKMHIDWVPILTLKVVLLFLGCVLVILDLIFIGLVKRWEQENAIKFSQRKFLYLFLVGILLMYVAYLINVSVASSAPDTVNCSAQFVFFHLGFWLVLLSLGAKTYRTYKIASNKDMRRVKITDMDLLKATGAFLFVIISLIVAQLIYAPQTTYVTASQESNIENVMMTIVVQQCSGRSSPIQYVIYALEVMALVYLGVLAHYTRKLPSAFAESQYIAMTLYNICLVAAFFSVLVGLVRVDRNYPDLFLGLIGFACVACIGGAQVMVLGPKFMLIIRGDEIRAEDILVGNKKRGEGSNMNVMRGGTPSSVEMSGNNPMSRSPSRLSTGGNSKAGTTFQGGTTGGGAKSPMFSVNEGSEYDSEGGMPSDSSVSSGTIDPAVVAGVAVKRGSEAGKQVSGALNPELTKAKQAEADLRKEMARQAIEMEKLKRANAELQKEKEMQASHGRTTSFAATMPPTNSAWQAFQDDDGKTYYYNTTTFACTYDVPKKW